MFFAFKEKEDFIKKFTFIILLARLDQESCFEATFPDFPPLEEPEELALPPWEDAPLNGGEPSTPPGDIETFGDFAELFEFVGDFLT